MRSLGCGISALGLGAAVGMYCNVFAAAPREIEALARDPDAIGSLHFSADVDLHKAWHGLHYLLTGHCGEAAAPLGFLLSGGRAIGQADWYWTATRLFSPADVKALDKALAAVSDENLWSRFDAARMNELEVYPLIWDESEDALREEYLDYFQKLKAFVSQAAAEDDGLVVQTPKLG